LQEVEVIITSCRYDVKVVIGHVLLRDGRDERLTGGIVREGGKFQSKTWNGFIT
jgi:hypothetical protein